MPVGVGGEVAQNSDLDPPAEIQVDGGRVVGVQTGVSRGCLLSVAIDAQGPHGVGVHAATTQAGNIVVQLEFGLGLDPGHLGEVRQGRHLLRVQLDRQRAPATLDDGAAQARDLGPDLGRIGGGSQVDPEQVSGILQGGADLVGRMEETHPVDGIQAAGLAGDAGRHAHLESKLGDIVQDLGA